MSLRKEVEWSCRHIGCEETFAGRTQRWRHEEDCEFPAEPPKFTRRDDKWICNTCNHEYTTQQNLSRHFKDCGIEKERKNKKSSHKCEVCPKTFDRKSKLIRHAETHRAVGGIQDTATGIQPTGEKPMMPKYICEYCNKEYSQEKRYLNHKDKVHKDNICPTFLRAEELGYMDVETNMNISDIDYTDFERDLAISDVSNEIAPEQVPNSTTYTLESPSLSNTVENSDVETDSINIHDNDVEHNISRTTAWRHQREKRHSVVDSICEELAAAKSTHNFYKIGSHFVQYLQSITNTKYRANHEIAKHLFNVFGDNLLDDKDMIAFLSKELKFTRPSTLHKMLQNWKDSEFMKKPSRHLSIYQNNVIHNMWTRNSILTVDRRNGRDIVRIEKSKFDNKFGGIDIPDEADLKPIITKRNTHYYTALRHIATCSTQKVREKIHAEYKMKFSTGSIHMYKPFYMTPATEKEKIVCMCQFCLNTRLQFDAIMKEFPSRPFNSISAYFMQQVTCPKGLHGYYEYSCVTNRCDACKNATLPVMSAASNPTTTSYYQYKVEKTVVPTVDGDKTYSNTERVQITEPFEQCVNGLNDLREGYILHRYLVCNQVKVFRDVCDTIPTIGPIFWWDFSENIKNVPKLEAQEHGYCAKNISLFCTVHMKGDNKQDYIYHLCENNVHDVCYTGTVAEDIFNNYFEGTIFRVKSDNCRQQFKCKWLFAFWKRFSSKFSIPVILYYGVEGHGKGLVDAMSSFGVKQPIRKEIITTDFWYRNASDLVSFLSTKFMDEPTKIYQEIDAKDLISKQVNTFDLIEYPIAGMSKMHMISFFPNGAVKGARNYCSCEKCMNGHFDQCSDCDGKLVSSGEVGGEFASSVIEEETNSELESNKLVENIYNEIIIPGSFIALHSFTSFELFYVCKVIERCVAKEDCVDDNGHCVLKGEPFLKCHYLCHENEKRGIHYYKEKTGIVFIQFNQILSPHVNVSEQLTISQQEYGAICEEL